MRVSCINVTKFNSPSGISQLKSRKATPAEEAPNTVSADTLSFSGGKEEKSVKGLFTTLGALFGFAIAGPFGAVAAGALGHTLGHRMEEDAKKGTDYSKLPDLTDDTDPYNYKSTV
ncbi:hypothetical protein IJ750_01760 [bacterium]|nr:hypothetical protein [bacterium]